MKRKLIYVSHGRLTDKISRDWYIDSCISNGIIVEYWDVVSLVREEHDETGSLKPDYLRRINSYNEIERLLKLPENRSAVYVMLLSYSFRACKIFRILSKLRCRMVSINWGAMPVIPETMPRIGRLLRRFFENPPRLAGEVFFKIIGACYKKLNLVKKFDIVFSAGQVLTLNDQYAKKIVPINLCDYDQYIRASSSESRLVHGRYVVFLDINLPYQSDLSICGLPAVDPSVYYESLNRFFILIENAYAVKVVIAAHPKANYDRKTFKQRDVYRLLTAELVKDADFVITHSSTSLSYAILNFKPVVFIYTDQMMELYRGTVVRDVEMLSSYLNVESYNIDKLTDGSDVAIRDPDRNLYNKYKYKFLTSLESESVLSTEIFIQTINSI